MDITTIGAIIAVVLASLGGVTAFVRELKKQPWKDSIKEVKDDFQNYKEEVHSEFSFLKEKIIGLEADTEKIKEINESLTKLEKSIDRESEKLEKKIDSLLETLIKVIGRK